MNGDGIESLASSVDLDCSRVQSQGSERPRLERGAKIAQALNVPVAALFADEVVLAEVRGDGSGLKTRYHLLATDGGIVADPRDRVARTRYRCQERRVTNTCGNVKTIGIGDRLRYKKRTYVVRSLQPMSIPERLADLEDAQTGEHISVPVERLTQWRTAQPSSEETGR